jgi:hypothetical protein
MSAEEQAYVDSFFDYLHERAVSLDNLFDEN